MAYHLSKKRRDNIVKTGKAKSVALLIHLADQKGFFHDYKVPIKIKTVPYARKSMELMLEGELNTAYLLEINIAYLGYLKSKIPIKCVASLEKRLSDSMVMRHDKDQKPEPADLLGKTIGFTPRTTSHSFLMRFLNVYNIPKSSITLKPISPQAMPDALVRGEVDAISIWHAYSQYALLAMNELGIPWTKFHNNGIYQSEVVLAVTKPFLIKHRNICIQLMMALKKAEDYIKRHPDELYNWILSDTGIDMNTLKKNQLLEHETITEDVKVQLEPIQDNFLNNVLELGQWITENDTQFMGQTIPDYNDFIDNSLFLDIQKKI